MKGLILAGGHGTRLRPLTHTDAKQLIPVANKPILFYVIDDLKKAGITDIGIIVGHTPERIKFIKDAVGDGSAFGVSVTYIEQDAPRGIAHAVGISEDFMANEPFVVYLGDNILKGGINEFVDKFKNSDYDAGMLLTEHPEPQRFGVAEIRNNEVIGLEEKPKKPKSNFVLTGIYLFRSGIFDIIRTLKPSWRNELEITEAMDKIVRSGKHKVMAHIVTGWWKDTGKPEDILEANHLVLHELKPVNNGKIDKGATVKGNVSIGKDTLIGKGAFIRGPAVIGKNCLIENSYIGPYTAIGDNTEIRNTEIESSIVIGNSKIDCNTRIMDSLIGKNTTITSATGKPKATKLILGENSFVSI